MANEQVSDWNSSDGDDDGNLSKDDDEEYEAPYEVYDGLNKCSKCKVIKLLLYFLKLQRHSSKMKSLK